MFWALRDAISAHGNYYELYYKNFGDVDDNKMGPNALNNEKGPQLLDMPGLQYSLRL